MPYMIPAEGGAAFLPMSRIFEIQTWILGTQSQYNAFFIGGAVSQQGTPNMTVLCDDAFCMVNGQAMYVPTDDVPITTAHGTLPRLDLVYIDPEVQGWDVSDGTPATDPQPPSGIADTLPAALVYVPALDGSIQTNQLIDVRMFAAMPNVDGVGSKITETFWPLDPTSTGWAKSGNVTHESGYGGRMKLALPASAGAVEYCNMTNGYINEAHGLSMGYIKIRVDDFEVNARFGLFGTPPTTDADPSIGIWAYSYPHPTTPSVFGMKTEIWTRDSGTAVELSDVSTVSAPNVPPHSINALFILDEGVPTVYGIGATQRGNQASPFFRNNASTQLYTGTEVPTGDLKLGISAINQEAVAHNVYLEEYILMHFEGQPATA